jgi:hypothetical protein
LEKKKKLTNTLDLFCLPKRNVMRIKPCLLTHTMNSMAGISSDVYGGGHLILPCMDRYISRPVTDLNVPAM